MRFLTNFSRQSLTYIFVVGIVLLFLFFSLFSVLVIYEEYSLFNQKNELNIKHDDISIENYNLNELLEKINNQNIKLYKDEENIYFFAEIPIKLLEQHNRDQMSSRKAELIRFLLDSLTLTLMIFLIVIAITFILESTIKEEIDKLIYFFRFHDRNTQCEISENLLKRDEVNFFEFKLLSLYANKMVKSLHKKRVELKNLNEHLEEKVKEKTLNLQRAKETKEHLITKQEKFIKYAIHETSTPIAVILSYIDLFRMQQGENRYLNRIESGAKMIQNIYNELSFLLQTDRLEFKKEEINFSYFLQERIEFFRQIAEENKLFFSTNIKKELFLNMNRTKLSRIIDNNLSNAIKYSFLNNDILVQLFRDSEEKIIFKISTKSPKINNNSKVFNNLYREDEENYRGFGIGLNMVKNICDEENIKINLESTEEITIFEYIF